MFKSSLPPAKTYFGDDERLLDALSEAKAELITLGDWLRFACKQFERADLFYGHGTDNAWDEALQLVVWVAGIPWDKHAHLLNARLTASEKGRLCEAIAERVAERKPLPYITGQAFFAELLFEVTPNTLIPRSPFAELIENGFQPWIAQEPIRMLDLCTGSGCIAIAAAKLFDHAEVDLSDISPEAIEVAGRNIARHKLQNRVVAIESDLFENVEGEYDLIISNPPYVDADDLASMPPEFQHEPTLALGSGDDGLDFTRRLLHEARDYLTDDGVLMVEVGNSWPALEAAFPDVAFTWVEFERGGHGVFVLTAEQLELIV